MKKYSLILIMLAFAVGAWAQKPRVTTFPAAFTLTEDVTLTIDVTGTALEGMSEDLYLWAWSNNGDNLNNGSWDNSGAKNRLTKVGDNVYTLTFKCSEVYANPVTQIQGLVKTQSGSAKTDDSDPILLYDFSQMDGLTGAVYPNLFGVNTPISIMVNLNNCGNITDKENGPVHMHGALNEWGLYQIDFNYDLNRTALKPVEGHPGLWKLDLIPGEYFSKENAPVPEDLKVTGIWAVFNNGTWDQKADDNGSDFHFVPAVPVEKVQPAEFFLSKFTAEDVLPVIIKTSAFEAGSEGTEADPLYNYNDEAMSCAVTLTTDNGKETLNIAAVKTADYTYRLVLLPARQFQGGRSATAIEISFSAGVLKSETVLKGSFVK